MPQEAIVCYQRAVQTRPNAIAFGECSFIIYRYKFMSYVAAVLIPVMISLYVSMSSPLLLAVCVARIFNDVRLVVHTYKIIVWHVA